MKHKEWLIRLNFPPKYIETSRQVLILYWVFLQHSVTLAPQHTNTHHQVSRTKARKAFLDPPGALCLFPKSALGWLNEESSEEQATTCDISIWTVRELLQSSSQKHRNKSCIWWHILLRDILLPSKSTGNDACRTVNSKAGVIKIIWSLPLCLKNWTPWQVAKIKHQRGPPQARLRINIRVRAHHLLTLTAGKKSWRHLFGGQGSGWPGRAAEHRLEMWACTGCAWPGWAVGAAGGLLWERVRGCPVLDTAGSTTEPPLTDHRCTGHNPPWPALLGHEGKLS